METGKARRFYFKTVAESIDKSTSKWDPKVMLLSSKSDGDGLLLTPRFSEVASGEMKIIQPF